MSIERIHRPSARSFRSTYLEADMPVVLTGLASEWLAVRTWSHEFLGRKGGSSSCSVRVSVDGHHRFETLPFSRAMRTVLHDGAAEHYIVRHPLALLPTELRAGVRSLDAYMGSGRWLPRRLEWLTRDGERLWIGPAGTVSGVHFDLGNNLFAQIVGRKRFRLFPPSQSALLHYPDLTQRSPQSLALDVENPDFDRFPRFREARSIDVDLHPGEILFLPQLWWHHVRALDPSVSLSSFWVTPTMLPAQRGYWYHRAKCAFLSEFRHCGRSRSG